MSVAETAAPEGPTELSERSWGGVLKRTVAEFRADNLTDWAASLTYYAVLALFPAIIALLSIVGLAGKSATDTLIENVKTVTSGPANDVLTNAFNSLSRDRGAAGLVLVFGLLLSLWSASAYIGAFARASNAIYEVEEGRPFWKLRPLQVLVTLVMMLLIAIAVVGIVVSGPLAEGVGKTIGVGDTAVTVWNLAKWPVILVVVVTCFSLLYYAAPNVKQPGFRWISPGAILGVVVWLLASAGFALYVANFSSYNKTYGSLGGVVAFLVWLWVSNVAVLLGAEFDAELERGRELAAGVAPEDTLALEPREAADDD